MSLPPAEDGSRLVGVPDALERLWTPHRWAYIEDHDAKIESQECPFCRAPKRSDEDALIVHRGELAYVILNLFPYNPGHMLVVPYRHVGWYTELTDAERTEMAKLKNNALLTLEQVSSPDGFNMGMNQGDVAGAGIAAHAHEHIVPRWKGDANFFPIIARTKALPTVLGDTRTLMSENWVS